jgi:hypothetical protein
MTEEEEEVRRILSGGRLRKRRKDGWSRRDERVFFKHFRATCNVNASARAAGKSPTSAHDLRRRDPVFAAGWDEALRDSHVRLHGKLIVYAETRGKEAALDEEGEPVEPSMADFDPDLAMRLLKYHQDSLEGGRRGRLQLQRASEEELTAAILHGLDALNRRLGKKRI